MTGSPRGRCRPARRLPRLDPDRPKHEARAGWPGAAPETEGGSPVFDSVGGTTLETALLLRPGLPLATFHGVQNLLRLALAKALVLVRGGGSRNRGSTAPTRPSPAHVSPPPPPRPGGGGRRRSANSRFHLARSDEGWSSNASRSRSEACSRSS